MIKSFLTRWRNGTRSDSAHWAFIEEAIDGHADRAGRNTCYRGGKPSVSDVFAAELWSADYSLLLASNDYWGDNPHGGTGKSVANSVGGSLPGDALLQANGETPEQIAAHPHPFYTPIATFGSDYTLKPVAYGLKFAGSFSGGTLLKTEFSTNVQVAGVNATAYAAKLPGGQPSVIILNKDAARTLRWDSISVAAWVVLWKPKHYRRQH